MADRLQRFLNAVTPRVGLFAGRGGLVLRPVRELAGAETPHAVDLVGADLERLGRGHENQRRIRGSERLGKPVGDPALRRVAIVQGQIDQPATRADMERRDVLADRFDRVGDLALGALLQLLQKIVEHRGGVETRRAESVQQDIVFLQGQQLAFPGIGDRALLGQQRTRPELERNRAELRVADPIGPFAQIPNAAGHEDRRCFEAEFLHQTAQFANPRVGGFRPQRVFAVGDAVMTAGQPRILVNDAAEPVAEFVIGAFPQGAKGAPRGDDWVIVDAITGADFGDPVRHAGAAGDAMDQPAGAFQHTVQDALGRGHLPQHIHVDAALPVRALVGDAGLLDPASDRVRHQFLMPLAAGPAEIDLRDRLSRLVVAVGVDPGERADPTRGSPCARAFAVRDRNPLAALDERPYLAPGNHERLKRLH